MQTERMEENQFIYTVFSEKREFRQTSRAESVIIVSKLPKLMRLTYLPIKLYCVSTNILINSTDIVIGMKLIEVT